MSHHHPPIGLLEIIYLSFRAIASLLRMGLSKGFISRLEFRHDVYKYLFGDSLQYRNFDRRYFCKGWDQLIIVLKKSLVYK